MSVAIVTPPAVAVQANPGAAAAADPAAAPTAAVSAKVTPQVAAEAPPKKSAAELKELSKAFLSGSSLPAALAPATVAAKEAGTLATGTTEGDSSTPGAPLEDPGDDSAETTLATADGPKWIKDLLSGLPDGAMPDWAPKRIVELVERSVAQNAAVREKDARIAELEEAATALRTDQPASFTGDPRGEFRKVTDPAALQNYLQSAQSWIDWARTVKPNEAGEIPNPDDTNGEAWTPAQVLARSQWAMGMKDGAQAQLTYLSGSTQTRTEIKKALPALYDSKSPEHGLAVQYLSTVPGIDHLPDRDALIARLVLGHQALEKRLKGSSAATAQTHGASTGNAGNPNTTAAASASPPVGKAPAVPLKSTSVPTPMTSLRKAAATGSKDAQREISRRFLETA